MLSSAYEDLLSAAETTLKKTAADAYTYSEGERVRVSPSSGSFFYGTVIGIRPGEVSVENEKTDKMGWYSVGMVKPLAAVKSVEEETKKRDAEEREKARIKAEEKARQEAEIRKGEMAKDYAERGLAVVKDVPKSWLGRVFSYVNIPGGFVRVHYAPHSVAYAKELFRRVGKPLLMGPYTPGEKAQYVVGGVTGDVWFPIPPEDPNLDSLKPMPPGLNLYFRGRLAEIPNQGLAFTLIGMGLDESRITK